MPDFVHLHVHSNYSLLDGAVRVKPEVDRPPETRSDLASRVKRLGMPGVALTDHANMFGAITFYKACKEAGIKAILGSELNIARAGVAPGGRTDAAPVDHLVCLAATDAGYHNIARDGVAGVNQPREHARAQHPDGSADPETPLGSWS